MKKSRLFALLFLLVFSSLFIINYTSAFDWSRITGFAIRPFQYDLTCVYYGTQIEGPTKDSTDVFSNATLTIYNSKTHKYSGSRSDSCINRRIGRNYSSYLREAYCIKKDTKVGRRDEIKYSSKVVLCENGCSKGACIKNIPPTPTYCKKILENGLPSNRVNLFFVPSLYTNMSQFEDDLNEFVFSNDGGLFSYEPLRANKSLFNVYIISNLSFEVINENLTLSEGYFYSTGQENDIKKLAENCIQNNSYTIVFIHNSSKTVSHGGMASYGDGNGTIFLQRFAGSLETGYYLNKKTLIHEFGHAFIDLGDEYENSLSIQNFSKRPNLDVEGCPKWCSGELNTEAPCYGEYILFRDCLYNVTNNLSISYHSQCSYNSDITACDLGKNCLNETGCYWNAKSLITFRSSESSIMKYPDENDEFNLISQETISNKINQIISAI